MIEIFIIPGITRDVRSDEYLIIFIFTVRIDEDNLNLSLLTKEFISICTDING